MLNFERIFNIFYLRVIKIIILREIYSRVSKATPNNISSHKIDKRQSTKTKSSQFQNNWRPKKLI